MTDLLLILCFLLGLAEGAFVAWWFTSGYYLRQFRRWLDELDHDAPESRRTHGEARR